MWQFRAKKSDRLDRILREEGLPGSEWLSRQAWDALFEEGKVEVSGRKVRKAGAPVAAGAEISVRIGLPVGLRKANPSLPVWTGEGLALFDKACGQSSYPLLPWEEGTLANAAAAFFEEKGLASAEEFARLASPPILEGGLIQRLDRDTSGALLVAYEAGTKALFRKYFSEGAVEKSYLAIVTANARALAGERRVWLKPAGAERVRASLVPPGKGEAEESRLSIEICAQGPGGALLRVRTRQGSRHVVRASLCELGAPLYGDALYGGDSGAAFHQLHAESVGLTEGASFPDFPQNLKISPPQSFLDSLANLGLHWGG